MWRFGSSHRAGAAFLGEHANLPFHDQNSGGSRRARRASETAYPTAAKYAKLLRSLNEEVEEHPPAPFFEPVSVTLIDARQRSTLLSVGADDLHSWTAHIAGSMWCRLRTLEAPILENFTLGNTLVGMVLLRAHLEAAAMAAYCLQELTGAARASDFGGLGDLISKTLFGTSLLKHRDKENVADRLYCFETKTVDRICRAVDALDAYYYQEHADRTLGVLYSLLCEYAHPNHRGVMDFMTAAERAGGWSISYGEQRRTTPEMATKVMETLVVTMQGGHSACEMLRYWRFSTDANGALQWSGPSPDDADRIWQRLLQRPIP